MTLYARLLETWRHHAPKDKPVGERLFMHPNGVRPSPIRSRERRLDMEPALKRKPGAEHWRFKDDRPKPPMRAVHPPIEDLLIRHPLIIESDWS